MRAAISLPTTGTIPEPCSTISATRTSSTPSDTPSFRLTGSATSGEISVDWRPRRHRGDWHGLRQTRAPRLRLLSFSVRPPEGGLSESENYSRPHPRMPSFFWFWAHGGRPLGDVALFLVP